MNEIEAILQYQLDMPYPPAAHELIQALEFKGYRIVKKEDVISLQPLPKWMLSERISETIKAMGDTGWSIGGGYMPHGLRDSEISDRDIHYADHPNSFSIVSPATIHAFRKSLD